MHMLMMYPTDFSIRRVKYVGSKTSENENESESREKVPCSAWLHFDYGSVARMVRALFPMALANGYAVLYLDLDADSVRLVLR